MNTWQTARQLKFLLAQATWPDAPAPVVFASVHVTAGPADGVSLSELRLPFALVRVLDAEADPDEPRLMLRRFELVLATAVAGDAIGERAIIGGQRSGGQGSSFGRGILELEEEALAAVQQIDQTSGVRLWVRSRTAAEGVMVEDVGYVATLAITVEAQLTTGRHYHPPLQLAAAQGAAGEADLTWTLPPARFDRRRVRLRRAAGAVAPAAITDGAEVALAGDLVELHTDASGAGQFSWSLFTAYTETGAAVDERFSAPVSVTLTVA